jgi:hypothetical protein
MHIHIHVYIYIHTSGNRPSAIRILEKKLADKDAQLVERDGDILRLKAKVTACGRKMEQVEKDVKAFSRGELSQLSRKGVELMEENEFGAEVQTPLRRPLNRLLCHGVLCCAVLCCDWEGGGGSMFFLAWRSFVRSNLDTKPVLLLNAVSKASLGGIQIEHACCL